MRLVADRPDLEAVELCDGWGRRADGVPVSSTHGCWRCCGVCNVHEHTCPGCGHHLEHGIGVCLRCRNEVVIG